MLGRPWWERFPERLAYEERALWEASIPFNRDEAAFAEGRLVLHLEAPLSNGERIPLVARFPALYPYERLVVYAPTLDLDHHQDPFGKSLCVFGRASDQWRVGDTLANVILERLPLVLQAGTAREPLEARAIEQRQAEPFSEYYPYTREAILLVDGAWTIDPRVRDGSLLLGYPESDDDRCARGAVLEVRDRHHALIAQADPSLVRLFPRHLTGRWVRAERPIREGEPARFLEALYQDHPWIAQRRGQTLGRRTVEILGVLFPEEHRWRDGSAGDGWVFARLERRAGNNKLPWHAEFVRAGRAGRGDLDQRTPELQPLAGCTVALFGLGGVGSPCAVHLARAGVGTLRMLDGDYVDPATARRWQLGLAYAGVNKTTALCQFLRANFPYTVIETYPLRLGDPDAGPHEIAALDAMLAGADLVIDATAERGLQYMLSDLARERGIPYLCLWSTKGAWGGVVARIRPQGSCWYCLQLSTGSVIPIPLADPHGEVQPTGCADPTFTGAGFDLEQVALTAVRLAVGTLVGARPAAYPDAAWDVAVGAFRNADGAHIPPSWQTSQLSIHPECPRHGDQR